MVMSSFEMCSKQTRSSFRHIFRPLKCAAKMWLARRIRISFKHHCRMDEMKPLVDQHFVKKWVFRADIDSLMHNPTFVMCSYLSPKDIWFAGGNHSITGTVESEKHPSANLPEVSDSGAPGEHTDGNCFGPSNVRSPFVCIQALESVCWLFSRILAFVFCTVFV